MHDNKRSVGSSVVRLRLCQLLLIFFSSSQSQPHSSRNSQYVEQNLRVLSVVKLTSQPLGRLAGRFMDREGPPCFDRNATGNKTHPSFEPLMRILNIMHPFSFPYFYGRSVFY